MRNLIPKPTSSSLLVHGVGIFLVAVLCNCASTEKTADGDVVSNDAGNGSKTKNDGEAVNNAEGNDSSGNGGNQGFAIDSGEAVNNDAANEFADDSDTLNLANEKGNKGGLNLSDNKVQNASAEIADEVNSSLASEPANAIPANTAPTNAALNTTTPLASESIGNTVMTNAATAAPAPEEAAAPADAALTPATPAAAPTFTSGGNVRYAKRTLSATAQPGAGDVVKTLEQGDHPVIIEEGEFARMQNGTYVPLEGLSVEGVGRARSDEPWRSGK